MDKLKVCFVGIGSIAKRHIRNLSELCMEKGISLEIDAFRRSGGFPDGIEKEKLHAVYTKAGQLPDNYDVIFLTNPTEFHLKLLKELHKKADHFFIEKPLASYQSMGEASGIHFRKSSVYYVACPLRYTGVIQYLKRNVDKNDVISVRCISSSYLPEWRPGIDYRETYSAKKELGGGVSLDLIHEWDYIYYLFGKPEKIVYTFGKKSSLELDCEDYAIYVAEYPDKVVELHLDYFGRKPLREIMLFTEKDTIVGDLIHQKVSFLRQGQVVEFSEKRDQYQKKELEHFLDMVEGKAVCDHTIEDAYRTMLFTKGEIG